MLLFFGFIQLDRTRTQAFTTINTVHTFNKNNLKKNLLALPLCPNLCYAKPTTFFFCLIVHTTIMHWHSDVVQGVICYSRGGKRPMMMGWLSLLRYSICLLTSLSTWLLCLMLPNIISSCLMIYCLLLTFFITTPQHLNKKFWKHTTRHGSQ